MPDPFSKTFALAPMTPEVVGNSRAYIAEHRTTIKAFDIVVSHDLPVGTPQETAVIVHGFSEAGVMWLLYDLMPWGESVEAVWARIRQGSSIDHLTLASRCRRSA